ESPPDQRAEKRGIGLASMVAGAWPRASIWVDRQLHFWHWFLLDFQVSWNDEACLRSGLGMLGNVDSRSRGALGGQYLFSAVASVAPTFGRTGARGLPDLLQDGVAAPAGEFRQGSTGAVGVDRDERKRGTDADAHREFGRLHLSRITERKSRIVAHPRPTLSDTDDMGFPGAVCLGIQYEMDACIPRSQANSSETALKRAGGELCGRCLGARRVGH